MGNENILSGFGDDASMPPINEAAAAAAAGVFAGARDAVAARQARLAAGAAQLDTSVAARKAAIQERRKGRQSMNGLKGRLDIKFNYGNDFYTYIFRDDPGRIQAALQAGFMFVKADEVESVPGELGGGDTDASGHFRVVLGHRDNGQPQYGYAMKQPWEFRNDDLAEREMQNLEVDQQIREGKLAMTPGEQRYIPRDTPVVYNPVTSGAPR